MSEHIRFIWEACEAAKRPGAMTGPQLAELVLQHIEQMSAETDGAVRSLSEAITNISCAPRVSPEMHFRREYVEDGLRQANDVLRKWEEGRR